MAMPKEHGRWLRPSGHLKCTQAAGGRCRRDAEGGFGMASLIPAQSSFGAAMLKRHGRWLRRERETMAAAQGMMLQREAVRRVKAYRFLMSQPMMQDGRMRKRRMGREMNHVMPR